MRASDIPGQQGIQGGAWLLRVPLTQWLLAVLALEEFRTFYHFIRALFFLKGCLILSGILCAQCQDSCKTDEESGVPAHAARICCVCHVPKQCCVAVTMCMSFTPQPFTGSLQGQLLGAGVSVSLEGRAVHTGLGSSLRSLPGTPPSGALS